MPNKTAKNVPHGITNLKRVCFISAVALNDNGAFVPIPLPLTASGSSAPYGSQLQMTANATDITIETYVDWSKARDCYVTLEYTKQED